jgi:hypothetical protein
MGLSSENNHRYLEGGQHEESKLLSDDRGHLLEPIGV